MGEYSKASRAYSKATQISSTYFNSHSESNTNLLDKLADHGKIELIPAEDEDLLGLHVDCLNNLAACKLLQKEFLQAKDLCIQVLQFDCNNFRALLRAARATLELDVRLRINFTDKS